MDDVETDLMNPDFISIEYDFSLDHRHSDFMSKQSSDIWNFQNDIPEDKTEEVIFELEFMFILSNVGLHVKVC